MKQKTPKEIAAEVKDPWKGIMTEENYHKYKATLPQGQQWELDYGLAIGDTNLLMSLGALGLYEPMKKRGRGRKNGAKK